MHCSEVETLKARKPHRCMSCGEAIAVGEEYKRWRCYDGGDASTNKMHQECYDAHNRAAASVSETQWEYIPYSYERGSAVDA